MSSESRVSSKGTERKKSSNKLWLKIGGILGLILGFAVILILVTPFGNVFIHNTFPGVDTPMDRIVRGQIVERVKKSDLSTKDKNRMVDLVENTKMSTVANAMDNADQAATLYAEYTGKDKQSARDVINSVYADKRLKPLREKIAKSDWGGAFKEYNKLAQDDTVNQVFIEADKNSSNSAKKMQQEASKLYNEATQAPEVK